MKTLGLIGGMSWVSTQNYYRRINEEVQRRLGGLHSAELILHSVDFAAIEAMQTSGEWKRAGARLAGIGRRLEMAGADGLVLCTNTLHKVADTVAQASSIPLLHIADPTREAIEAANHTRVGLLGTRFTMDEGFLIDRIRSSALEVEVPDAADRERLDRIIFDELCRGEVTAEACATLRRIVANLRAGGAEAVILGCTELTLLVDEVQPALPLFDTTHLHADAAVDFAVGDG